LSGPPSCVARARTASDLLVPDIEWVQPDLPDASQ